ncbi:hypothetical protein JCM6882_009435 [Rhodosporidiobolus microsporus]
MTATCPPFSSSFSPTSFASATHDGSSPSIPVFGRKTGLEGYVDEEGTSMITAAGEGDVEGCQLAWRMRALELGEKSEEGGGEAGAATTSPDTSFPSLSIGTSPHHPVSQSHFLPNAITADDLNTLGAVTQWRAALKEAHKTPTPTAPHSPSLPSLAISPDKLSSPPSLFLLPPSCEHSPHSSLAGGATPLARPEPVKELVSLSSDFNLHHGDVLDPGALPLPDVPTDYVFPDANGRASFSSEPFSPPPYGFGRAEMDTTSTPPPSSPPLPPVKVIPSPPSAFSASSSATGASPLPPLALSASLFPPSLKQKASNPESLIDLYRRDGSRRESFGEEEGDEAQVGEYEDEAARAFEREMETERRVQGEAFGNAASEFAGKYGVELPILLLPASFSANSNCPYCLLPLHDDPQTWADEHWACLPFLLGSTGEEGEKVRVVVAGGGGTTG